MGFSSSTDILESNSPEMACLVFILLQDIFLIANFPN